MKEVQILIIHVRGQKEREAFMQKQLDALGWPYHYVLDSLTMVNRRQCMESFHVPHAPTNIC